MFADLLILFYVQCKVDLRVVSCYYASGNCKRHKMQVLILGDLGCCKLSTVQVLQTSVYSFCKHFLPAPAFTRFN